MHRYFEEMNKKFNYTFDYTNSVYSGVNTEFVFLCTTHGDVITTPNQHRKIGCKHCNYDKERTNYIRSFVTNAATLHKGKYDYSKVTFKNNRELVTIVCPIHSDFKQTPSNHLKGHGCRACQYSNITDQFKKSEKTFIEECSIQHSYKYDYSKVVYKNSNCKVIIRCPEHGEFKQYAGHHVRGVGCPSCSSYGFNYERGGYLYFLEISDGLCYKVGITNLSVSERFTVSELAIIKVLSVEYYPIGKDAYDKEQAILKYYRDYRYTTTKPLKSGNTELFTTNLMKLKDTYETDSIGKLQT